MPASAVREVRHLDRRPAVRKRGGTNRQLVPVGAAPPRPAARRRRARPACGPGHPVPARPERAQQHAGRAEGEVVDGRAREVGRPRDGLRPAVVGRELLRAGRPPSRRPGALQRGEDTDAADQPVEVGAVGLSGDAATDPLGDPVRQLCSSCGPGPGEPDLGQHVGESADPAVHAVAVPRGVRGGRAVTDAGIQGPSSQRTWSSTQRQAASATLKYVSAAGARLTLRRPG